MATITLNDSAPQTESVHFLIGADEFDLKGSSSFETDDVNLIAAAVNNPWLAVEFPEHDVNEVAADYDPTDPHDNPAADHLTAQASAETKQEADAAEAAIHAVAFPNEAPVETAAPSTASTPPPSNGDNLPGNRVPTPAVTPPAASTTATTDSKENN